MKNQYPYRARLAVTLAWPLRKGLRAPAVHLAVRERNQDIECDRGDDRAAPSAASSKSLAQSFFG